MKLPILGRLGSFLGLVRKEAPLQILPQGRGLSSTASSGPNPGPETRKPQKMPTLNEPIDDQNLDKVFRQNEIWRREMSTEDPLFFEKLGSGHKPRYLWIGCADARVPANEIMGEGTGAVFVHRNVGNQVLSADVSVMSTIQYAVDYLKVPHIIVCGHYDCGAVKVRLLIKKCRCALRLIDF
jgi:carbonic anhydrase